MKKFRIALMLSVAPALVACSKMERAADTVLYEPTWVAVYDYPVSREGVCGVGLVLVQGRTDDDFSFTSPGAALSLKLHAPQSSGLLPVGEYDSDDVGDSRSIICSSTGDKASFVAERLPDTGETRVLPLSSGELEVGLAGGGGYVLHAVVEAGGRCYEFDYQGPVQDFRSDEN